MQKFLSLFPLNLIAFPLENLNLHIFEPRYRQLVNDAVEGKTTFGVPLFINNKLKGYGTEMSIVSIDKKYEDGRMDIKTRGVRIFRIVDFQNPFRDKLYAGGEVEWLLNEDDDEEINPELIRLVQKLYDIMKVNVSLDTTDGQPFSFKIAHKIGLSVHEEYELLTIETEQARQQKVIDHLYRIIPTLIEIERTKEIIKMNGHFKNLDPLNF